MHSQLSRECLLALNVRAQRKKKRKYVFLLTKIKWLDSSKNAFASADSQRITRTTIDYHNTMARQAMVMAVQSSTSVLHNATHLSSSAFLIFFSDSAATLLITIIITCINYRSNFDAQLDIVVVLSVGYSNAWLPQSLFYMYFETRWQH